MMNDPDTRNEIQIKEKIGVPPKKLSPLIPAILFSIIFSLSVMFLMVVIIDILNILLENYIVDPYYESDWQQAHNQYISMVSYLSPLGYFMFGLSIVLIVIGVIIKRYKLSFSGSLALYLPVFGYFSLAMTAIFAGIGVLRIVWIPILNLVPDLLNLGGIFFSPIVLLLPFIPIIPIFGIIEPFYPLLNLLLGERITFLIGEYLLLYIAIIGFFIFIFGVVTWFYGRFQGKEIIDFWIYRYSRHPQYLGIMIWNYGLFLPSMFSNLGIPPPTSPFLVLNLIIIGMAMHEENTMLQTHTQEYLTWRQRTAFIVPLPKGLRSIISYPMRKIIQKEWPESNKEIVLILLTYGILVVLISIPFVGFYYH